MIYKREQVLESLSFPEIVSELLPTGRRRGDEWEGRCPFHDDRNPSFGANLSTGLWKCHGCGESGDLFALYARLNGLSYSEAVNGLGKRHTSSRNGNGGPPKRKVKNPSISSISESIVEDLVKKMTSKTYSWLASKRGISEQVARKYQIGVWEKNEQKRFSIPIRDDDGKVVNVRLWLPPVGEYKDPEKRKAAGKIISWPDGVEGRGQARLWPLDQLQSPRLVLCEGEIDALALISQDTPAVTGTGGAGTWREEWSERFTGKVITIAYDADEEGRRGAEIVAALLWNAGASVRVLFWPGDRKEKHDVTDELLQKENT